MDVAVKNALLQEIAAVEKIDLPDVAAKTYPTQDLATTQVGPYTVLEVVGLVGRVVQQLESELAGPNWLHLPNEFVAPSTNGTSLQGSLSQIRSSLQQPIQLGYTNFSNWVAYLQALIGYQLQYGFWDRSSQKLHRPEALVLAAKGQELSTLTKQLAAQRQELTEGRALLEAEKTKLVKFYETKNVEFQTLAQQQQQGANLLQEINQFHSTGNSLSTKLDSLVQTQEKNLKTVEERQKEEQVAFEEFTAEYASIKKEAQGQATDFETKKEEFDGHLTFAHETETYLRAKRDEINVLTGFAADGALGHSFNERRDKLNVTVKYWRQLIPFVAGLTLLWILIVFSGFFGLVPKLSAATDNPWLNLLLNSLKTSPLVLFLLFAIKQYNRERNLQEEYAFRAAVAMTISAYADKLTTEENKEKMILESVQRVYTSPNISAPDRGFGLRLPSKEATEILKSLTEAIKELKAPA